MPTTETPKQIRLPIGDNPPPIRDYGLVAAATAVAGVAITLFAPMGPLYLTLGFGSFMTFFVVWGSQPPQDLKGWKAFQDFARSNDFALTFPHGFVYDPSQAKLFAHDFLRVASAGPYEFCFITRIAGRAYLGIER